MARSLKKLSITQLKARHKKALAKERSIGKATNALNRQMDVLQRKLDRLMVRCLDAEDATLAIEEAIETAEEKLAKKR